MKLIIITSQCDYAAHITKGRRHDVPLYQGKEAPPRLRFCAPPMPFVRLLIHCYSVKPAEMRGFLGMRDKVPFGLTPPGTRLARGVCLYNLTDIKM